MSKFTLPIPNRKGAKPLKPLPDFPLNPRAVGKWVPPPHNRRVRKGCL